MNAKKVKGSKELAERFVDAVLKKMRVGDGMHDKMARALHHIDLLVDRANAPTAAATTAAAPVVVGDPQPTGACCLPEGGCQVITQANCEVVLGSYQGDGTNCTACPIGGG
jgi:hypothetical protein